MDNRSKNQNQLIVSYLTLRRLIGWLGVSLPLVVYFGNWLFFTHRVGSCLIPSIKVPYSLSGYYYTHMRGVFTGAFSALGVFLIAYNGYEIWDQVITTAAGVAAIGIAIFPTSPPVDFLASQRGLCGPLVPVTYQSSSAHQATIGNVHLASLFVLIILLFIMALRFRKTSAEEAASQTDQEKKLKQRNNKIYLVSAALIAVGGAGALVQNFLSSAVKAQTPWLFWFEMVAIFAFGLSWFIKGAALRPIVNLVRGQSLDQSPRPRVPA